MVMAALTPVLKQMMLDGIMSSPSMPRLPRISATGIFFLWFAAVTAVLAVGFLLFAEYAYLTVTYTPEMAALGVACTAMAISLLSAATGMVVMNKRSAKAKRMINMQPQPDIAKTITGLIDSLSEELEEPIRENPKTAIMIASLAGFLAGDARH